MLMVSIRLIMQVWWSRSGWLLERVGREKRLDCNYHNPMKINKAFLLGSFFALITCLPLRAQPNILSQPQDATIQAGQRAFIVTDAFFSVVENPSHSVYLGVNPDTSVRLGMPINNGAGEFRWQSEPLFETIRIWMRLCDAFGCTDTRTVTITVISEEPNGAPAPFEDAAELGDGWWFSDWFDSFNINSFPWIFHAQHEFMFVFDGSISESIFLYDLSSEGWFFTSALLYPNLYSFGRSSWVFYFEDTAKPRQFVDLQSGEFWSAD